MNIVFFMYSLIPLIDVLPCVHCVQKIFQGAQKSSVTQQFSAAHHVRTISNVGTLLLCSSQCVLLGEMQCCKSFTYIESERLCHHFDKEAKATDLTFNTSSITYAVTRSNISSISKCHQYYFSQKDDIKKSWHDARQYCRNKWNGQGHLLRIETKEENEWIYDQIRPHRIWIGMYDASSSGNLVWENNGDSRHNFFQAFHPNEPQRPLNACVQYWV